MAAVVAPGIDLVRGQPSASRARTLGDDDKGKPSWRDLRMALRQSKSHKKKKSRKNTDGGSSQWCCDDSRGSPHDLDFSCPNYRSLVSVDDQSTSSRSSWKRNFESHVQRNMPLTTWDRAKLSKKIQITRQAKSEECSDVLHSAQQQEMDFLDRMADSYPTIDAAFVVDNVSNSVPDYESWHGLVTIGRESLDQVIPDSPDNRSSRKLRYVDVPMTPPHPNKKKEKRATVKRGWKSGGTPPSSPGVPWGDYAATQELQDLHQLHSSLDDVGSPGHTPKRLTKDKLRLDTALFVGKNEDPVHSLIGMWDDLAQLASSGESVQSESFPCMNLDMGIGSSWLVNVGLSVQKMPDNAPVVFSDDDSFLARFHAIYSDENKKAGERVSENFDLTENRDNNVASIVSVSSDDPETTHDVEEGNMRDRMIRFADEQGLPLEKTFRCGDQSNLWATGRIIVLFLDPVMKKFEFMQGEFSHQGGATVADLLSQLPSFATEERFAAREYVSIFATSGGPRELNSKDRLYELDLGKREITVAVMKGDSGEQLVNTAAPILANEQVMKAVSAPDWRLSCELVCVLT